MVISHFPTNIHHTNHLIRPVNREELFNLCHAQAQNVVEHIFGVLKHQFCILLIGPEYDPKIQARIVSSLCTIHNFICIHDPKEGELAEPQDPEYGNRGSNAGDEMVTQLQGFDGTKPEDIVQCRNLIAQAVWDSYQALLQERASSEDNEDDEDDIFLSGGNSDIDVDGIKSEGDD